MPASSSLLYEPLASGHRERRLRGGLLSSGVAAGAGAAGRTERAGAVRRVPPASRFLPVVSGLRVVEALDGLGASAAGAAEESAADEAVVGDFGERDEAEAHAEAEQTAGAGDVRDPAHLLRLAEALRVRLL